MPDLTGSGSADVYVEGNWLNGVYKPFGTISSILYFGP